VVITRRRMLQGAVLSGVVSALPRAARSQGTGNIFVSTEKGNEVVVFDAGFQPITRIATHRRPRDMHFAGGNARLFVACGDDDVIDVIDVASLEVVDAVPTGPSPEVFAFSPDETLIYVANEEDSCLEIIDVEARQTMLRIDTGAEPEGVIVSEDGGTIYVTSEVADMVHVVDVASGAVVKNILVGTRPRRFLFHPGGKELWVSCELSSEIYVIDRTSNEIIGEPMVFVPPGLRREEVTPVGMALTADGSRILLSLGRANHVAVIDPASRQVIAYILVGSRAWSVDLSRNDNIAIVANGLSDDVTIIDMRTLAAVQSFPVGRVPHSVLIDD
jgi:PQQ-dependent catabolism-associated beta-propeller protein